MLNRKECGAEECEAEECGAEECEAEECEAIASIRCKMIRVAQWDCFGCTS